MINETATDIEFDKEIENMTKKLMESLAKREREETPEQKLARQKDLDKRIAIMNSEKEKYADLINTILSGLNKNCIQRLDIDNYTFYVFVDGIIELNNDFLESEYAEPSLKLYNYSSRFTNEQLNEVLDLRTTLFYDREAHTINSHSNLDRWAEYYDIKDIEVILSEARKSYKHDTLKLQHNYLDKLFDDKYEAFLIKREIFVWDMLSKVIDLPALPERKEDFDGETDKEFLPITNKEILTLLTKVKDSKNTIQVHNWKIKYSQKLSVDSLNVFEVSSYNSEVFGTDFLIIEKDMEIKIYNVGDEDMEDIDIVDRETEEDQFFLCFKSLINQEDYITNPLSYKEILSKKHYKNIDLKNIWDNYNVSFIPSEVLLGRLYYMYVVENETII